MDGSSAEAPRPPPRDDSCRQQAGTEKKETRGGRDAQHGQTIRGATDTACRPPRCRVSATTCGRARDLEAAAILAFVKAQPLSRPAIILGDSFRFLVDDELSRFVIEERREVASFAPEALVLIDEIASLLGAGGKRLRPLFCYWGHRAGGGTDGPELVRAAAAIELLHTSAIIHDDLMDRSKLRRGLPASFRTLGGEGPAAERHGQSAAILAGDLAQALADRLLARSGFPPDRVLTAFEHFNRMRVQAVSGEFLDLLSALRGEAGEEETRRTAALKSGSYTVVGPLLVGASLAGASTPVMESLERYGRPLGEAFQLRDDVLGTFGNPDVTGKDRDTDIREGKQTTLLAKARQSASPQLHRLLNEGVGRPGLTTEEVDVVREGIRDMGALAQTIALIDALAVQAKAELATREARGVFFGQEVAGALGAMADLVVLRDA
jgi:geranylgeranyl diphosphate synthase type I